MATNDPLVCDMLDMGCHVDTLKEWFLGFFQWVWEGILTAVVAVLSAIPVPDWIDNLATFSVPDGVLWFASVAELDYGAAVMASAYTVRFIIRRIPVIG